MEPLRVAVVGMSCRLPDQINEPETLWDFCTKAQCTAAPIPSTRFNPKNFYHPVPNKLGHFNTRNGSYMSDDISLFDAAFFNITEAEAKTMDPQHRILLECAFLALENAGLDITSLAGRADVGVFAASSKSEYEHQINQDPVTSNRFAATGNASSMFANRISYFFNFRGPSISFDTACSSSLTAVHLAVESLRSGDCTTAIVGGSQLQLSPALLSCVASLGAVGAAGRSYSFDHRADGYGRGDGAGCLVLRKQDFAQACGDPIRAVLRGTGLNHSGRSSGITLPSEDAQRELIRKVYANAGLDPRETGYVECHGTGTFRGDPIEARAVASVFSKDYPNGASPLFIGSVKSNLGHTEAASGIMALIKAVLVLERETILPNANFEKPNPELDLDALRLKVPVSCHAWPAGKAKRVSINNFGFGGSNSHAILEQAPRPQQLTRPKQTANPQSKFFSFSAKDATALQASISAYAEQVSLEEECDEEQAFLENLSYTLCCRRTHFNWRYAITATNCQELAEKLKLQSPADQPGRISIARPLIFAFTGQGAQWATQGIQLIQFAVYRASMEEANAHIRSFGASWSLLDEISRPAKKSRLNQAEFAQPAVTALQISLLRLLSSWVSKRLWFVGTQVEK